MKDIKIENKYTSGLQQTTAYFTNDLFNDNSIQDIKNKLFDTTEAIVASTDTSTYNVKCVHPEGYFPMYDQWRVRTTLQFGKTDGGVHATMVDADVANVASTFNFWKSALLKINTIDVQRQDEIGQINNMMKHFTHTKSNLESNEQWLSRDKPSAEVDGCLNYSRGASISAVNLTTDATLDGQYITFTDEGAGTGGAMVATPSLVGGTQEAKDQAFKLTFSKASNSYNLDENHIGLKRREQVIEPNSYNNIYTFNLPLWFFFPIFRSMKKNHVFPFKQTDFEFTRNADAKYLIASSVTPNIKLIGLKVLGVFVKYNPPALLGFQQKITPSTVGGADPPAVVPAVTPPAPKENIVIPFTRIDHNILTVTGDELARKSEHVWLQYVINTFSETSAYTTQYDPFQCRQPRVWTDTNIETANVTIDMEHDYDSVDLFTNDTKRVYNGKTGDALIGYTKYKQTCNLLSKNRDDYALSYDEWMKYYPIYVSRVGLSLDFSPKIVKKRDNMTLNEKFTLSANASDTTQMRSFYLKQAFLVFDPITGVVTTRNSKV